MKFRFQNYAIIMLIENSCIIFNNYLVCENMTLRITKFYAKWLTACPNMTSLFRTIATFKSLVKTFKYVLQVCP
jgi:hypothetical protein